MRLDGYRPLVEYVVEMGRLLKRMREEPLDPEGRPRAAMSHKELARLLGKSDNLLRMWERLGDPEAHENSTRNPSPANVQAWARACGYGLRLEVSPVGGSSEVEDLARRILAAPRPARRLASLALDAAEEDPFRIEELEAWLRAWLDRRHARGASESQVPPSRGPDPTG